MISCVSVIDYSENGYNETISQAHNLALKLTSELIYIIKPFFNDLEKETLEYDEILKNHHIKALFIDSINDLAFKTTVPVVLILDSKKTESIKKAIQIITDQITEKDILLVEDVDAIYTPKELKTLIYTLEHNKINTIIGR